MADRSVAVRLSPEAAKPLLRSASIHDPTLTAIVLVASTPEPARPTPVVPPPARATEVLRTTAWMPCAAVAVMLSNPLLPVPVVLLSEELFK